MVELSEGQRIAAGWFGLAPWWWGWIVAALAVAVAVAVAVVRPPAWLAPREDAAEPDPAWIETWTKRVITAGLVLMSPGLLGKFNLFDDQRQILADPMVTKATFADLWTVIATNYKGTNQELMYLSMQLNWMIAQRNYAAWYLANLAVLVPVCWLLARFATWAVGSRMAGPIAVAWFVTTPLLAELMAWMSARSHLYGLVFVLASLAAWGRFRSPDEPDRNRWYWLSVLAFGLSQLGKPIFLFLPGWLIVLDLYQGRRDWAAMIREKIPYAVVAAAFVYKFVFGAAQRLVKPTPLGGSYYHTVLQDLNLLVDYGRTLLIPSETGILPPMNVAKGWFEVDGTPMVLACGFAPAASAVILAATGVTTAILFRRGWRWPLVWFVAGLMSYVLVLNIPFRGTAAAFEYRYTWSSQVLTAVLAASAGVALWRSGAFARWPRAVIGVASAIFAWRIAVTGLQVLAWHDSVTYWTRAAKMYPQTYFSNYYAGKSLQHAERPKEALAYLYVAEKYTTGDWMLYKRFGDNEYMLEQYELARMHWAMYFGRYPHKVTDSYREKFKKVGLDLDEARRAVRGPPIAPIDDDPNE